MDMTLSLFDCWEDFGVKFDVYDVDDSPISVAEVFSVVAEDSEREAIPLEANTAKALPVKQKDQRTTDKKRQRRTPKQEIERLRLLERNLKLQLETLQLQAHIKTRDHHIYPHSSDAVSFWKNIASRQYAQRIDSERENIRLKKVVKLRIAHAKRLKRTMNQLLKSISVSASLRLISPIIIQFIMDSSPVFAPLLVACDDAATLEAALDFVDNCDDLPSDVEDPNQAQDFDVTLSELLDKDDIKSSLYIEQHDIASPLEPSRRRRTTPKQEIAQLRAEERDLACRLEILRLQAYDDKQRTISSKNSKVLPFWKKIASRQYQTRLDSERENRRLRSLMKMHVGRAKRLTIAWKKQMTAEGYKKENATIGQLSDVFAAPDTPAVVEQLKNDVDEVYTALDAFCTGIRQHHLSRVPFLEHSEAYSVPFTRQTVDRAIWHRLESRFHGNQQQLSSTDDTITCCARRSLQLPGMNLTLRIRYVARKFHEADRAVIISRTFIQPLHLKIPAQVGFRETQVYIVTSRGSSVEGNVSAHVDTHTSVTGDGPDRGTGDGMRAWMTSPDASDVRGVWMTALQLRKNGIEDLLFEESRTQR